MATWLTSSRPPSGPSACRGSAVETQGQRSHCARSCIAWACGSACIPGTCPASRTSCWHAIVQWCSCTAASGIATKAARSPRRRRATPISGEQSLRATLHATARSLSSYRRRAGGFLSFGNVRSHQGRRQERQPPGWRWRFAARNEQSRVAHLLSHLQATMHGIAGLALHNAMSGDALGKRLGRS